MTSEDSLYLYKKNVLIGVTPEQFVAIHTQRGWARYLHLIAVSVPEVDLRS